MYYPEKAIAPAGRPARQLLPSGSLGPSYSMSLLTKLDGSAVPLVVSLREDSNNQYDFLSWVKFLIDNHHLLAGDFFIVDNASVHVGDDISEELDEVLEQAEVRMVTLPTYSPELNPCELIFAQVKRAMKESDDMVQVNPDNNRLSHKPFKVKLRLALDRVSVDNVTNYYRKCIVNPGNY